MNYKNTHHTKAMIDLRHLTHNMKLLQKMVGDRPLFPAIKANAYGHGASIIGRHLIKLGYKTLCTAHIAEAAELVEQGLDAKFIILSSNLPENSEYYVHYGFEPFVCTIEQIKSLAAAAKKAGKQVAVHLKIDTGMGRVGINSKELIPFLEKCVDFPEIMVKSITSHFPRADESDKSFSNEQIETFRKIIKQTRKYHIKRYHFANSAAIFDLPEAHFDAARPGISIYGLKPSADILNPEVNNLIPVLTWKTQITFLKEVPENTGISYGHTYKTDKPSLIASVPLGYGDGLSRLLSSKMDVLIHGTRCPQVGRICMDQSMIDVTHLRGKVEIGDEVIVIGKQGKQELTADEMADTLGTINYEIVTSIAARVPRVVCK